MGKGARNKRPRESSFGWLVTTLGRRLDAAMREELAPHELDLASFATLMTLYDREGVSQATLATGVGVPSYATTRTLDKLEQQGRIVRERDPNSRRSHRIVLTDDARRLRSELFAIVSRVNARMLAALDPSERARLVSVLQTIEKATRGHPGD